MKRTELLARITAAALAGAAASCGFRPLHGAVPEAERLALVAAPAVEVDPVLAAALEAGARDALARAGALRAGTEPPRLVVELLRADATAEGIALGDGTPRARATRTAVRARAWLERAPGERARDTGDLAASEVTAVQGAPLAQLLDDDVSRSAAARRLGERLALRVLGVPVAPDDLP